MAILNPWPNIKDNEINDNTTWSSNKINSAFEFIKDQEVTIEKTDNIVNFKNCNTDPFILVNCDINPTQSGTGNPSPDNVRAIMGYSTINVHNDDTVYPIALGQTIYGGNVEVVGGSGTSELKYIEIDGTEASLTLDSSPNVIRLTLSDLPSSNVSSQDYRYWGNESIYKYVATGSLNNNEVTMRTSGYLYYKNTSCTTLLDFQTFFANQKASGTPFAVCYELANPTDFTFTGQEINSIEGVNNVYHDANGNITVKYKTTIRCLIDQ